MYVCRNLRRTRAILVHQLSQYPTKSSFGLTYQHTSLFQHHFYKKAYETTPTHTL